MHFWKKKEKKFSIPSAPPGSSRIDLLFQYIAGPAIFPMRNMIPVPKIHYDVIANLFDPWALRRGPLYLKATKYCFLVGLYV